MRRRRQARTWILGALVAGVLCGCISATVRRHVVYQELCAGRYAELARSGKTTRDEDRDYILANERAWHFLREAMGIESTETETETETREVTGGRKNTESKQPAAGRKVP